MYFFLSKEKLSVTTFYIGLFGQEEGLIVFRAGLGDWAEVLVSPWKAVGAIFDENVIRITT